MAAPSPRPGSERRRRPRRGSVERPVSGRLYRAAWALVALPLLVAAFTVGRPEPLPKPDLPPSFDGETAVQLAEELATTYPNRVPGSPEARDAAVWVADRLREYGLSIDVQPFRATIPGLGETQLVNVIATTPARDETRSPDAIVVVAHRDNSGLASGLDDNASGTAALIELARNLSALTLAHPIVFASLDGGAYGNLGAAALAERPGFRGRALAVLALDSLAGRAPPRLQFAGDRARSPTGVLLATADASVFDELRETPGHPNPFLQLLDLAFPYSLYDQAPFVGAGISAVTLTAARDRPEPPGEEQPLDPEAVGGLGRAAQTLVASLDAAAEVARGTDSFVYLGGRYVRGFAIQFVLVVALLPVLLAAVDLTARLRRRGVALGPALRSYRRRLGAWAWTGALAALFAALGLFPTGASRPLSPDTAAAQDWPFGALVGLALLAGLGWFVARIRLLPRAPVERGDELGGHLAAMLALCVVAVVVAITNPFALLLVLPSLHAWLWAPHLRDGHLAARAALFALGFVGPVVLVGSFALRFGLGFDAPWYVATLFTVGYASLPLFLCLLAWAAAAGQVGAILFGRYAPYPSPGEGPDRAPLRDAAGAAAATARRLGARRRAPDAAWHVRD